jgi:hypothetical protein
MSLAYVGTSGRGEVAALMSFSIHISPSISILHLQRNKMAGVIENYSKFEVRAMVRFLQQE